eukprot:jgi/Ulvmu1/9354/UM050_0106.1
MAFSLRRALSKPLLRACGAQASYASSNVQTSSIAVVGSGPSGFYFVDRLRRLLGGNVKVDVFERLPAPYGLVRYGVAPDHPNTKNVINKFDSIASEVGVRFFGNVHVGEDVSMSELRSHYRAVVLACGAEDDRHMGIPGEDCKAILSARQFVNWYNGHPDFTDAPVDLQHVRSVGIIGLGNVALDCARVLLRPVDELSGTDIADHALQQLRSSRVNQVHIIGRRGPLQSQFSGKELREVLSLSNTAVEVHPAMYQPTKEDAKEPRKAQKGFQELQRAHGKSSRTTPHRILHFHFLCNPVAANTAPDDTLGSLSLQPQALEAGAGGGRQVPVPVGTAWDLPMDMLLRSVGYRGVPVAGIPFDSRRGIIPNTLGRVEDDESGKAVEGVYVAGWLKRGPQGIIGTNLVDAEQTARCMVEDLGSLPVPPSGQEDMANVLQSKGVKFVGWDAWKRIDGEEQRRGAEQGRPRVKVTDRCRMLQIAEGT